jgi:hypothetical protein
MAEVHPTTEIVRKICEQLSDDKSAATGEVMTAAAIVAVTAGLDDDQAVTALRRGLKGIREADAKGLH